MKVRRGFVSNSSSCSFLIYGVCIDENIPDYDNVEKVAAKFGYGWNEITISDGGTDGYYMFIGFSYDSMKQEETRAQFEARSKEAIDKILTELGVDVSNVEYAPQEAAWRDG